MNGLDALFQPRSIAVIGASAEPTKIGGRPVFNLQRFGYEGAIYPINPRSAEVQGLKAHAAISQVPSPVDLAVLAIPAAGVPAALTECGAAGVRAAVVFSSGFAETGAAGVAAQDALVAAARQAGLRLLGPNCLGLMNIGLRAICTFGQGPNQGLPASGGMSIVSQSGAFGTYTFVVAKERGLPVNIWVSTGNEADVDFADCVEWLAGDDQTRVIMGYMEGCRDGAKLRAALATARRAGKPVIVMKVGRTAIGAAAVQSHTAALAGTDAVFDAVFRQDGAYRASTVDEFFDVGYACLSGYRPRGDRLGIITMSGGAGVLMADAAADAGLQVPPMPEAAQAEMLAIVPFAAVRNPVDVTGQIANDQALFGRFGEVALRQGGFDAVAGFHAVSGLDETTGPAVVGSWRTLRANHPELPVFLAMKATEARRRELEALHIPVFEEPTRMIRAISALRRLSGEPDAPRAIPPAHSPLPQGSLTEAEAAKWLSEAGIPVAPGRIAVNETEAVAAAAAVGYPVVLKIVSPDIAHKSDVGGVALDLADADAVATAWRSVNETVRRARPDAAVHGVLVAPMLRGGVEMVTGVQADPVFGPVVMLGMGGVLVEVLRDVTFRVAPFGLATAHAMIAELRGTPLLDGVRGRPACDKSALAEILVRLGDFATAQHGHFSSIEINPLLVRGNGQDVVGLDALIVTCGMGDA